MERARVTRIVARKPGHQGAAAIAQTDTDVTVEQAMAVAVLGDEQQAAMEVSAGAGRGAGAPTSTGQQLLNPAIERPRTLRALAYGSEDAEPTCTGERFGGVARFCKCSPV